MRAVGNGILSVLVLAFCFTIYLPVAAVIALVQLRDTLWPHGPLRAFWSWGIGLALFGFWVWVAATSSSNVCDWDGCP